VVVAGGFSTSSIDSEGLNQSPRSPTPAFAMAWSMWPYFSSAVLNSLTMSAYLDTSHERYVIVSPSFFASAEPAVVS